MKISTHPIAALPIVIALLVNYGDAQADGPRTPMQKYEGSYAAGMLLCSLAVEAAEAGVLEDDGAGGKRAPDAVACVKKYRADLKANYDAAVRGVTKPKARAAIKEHFILASNALAAIMPNVGEPRYAYKNRLSVAQAKADEQWARFEAEK